MTSVSSLMDVFLTETEVCVWEGRRRGRMCCDGSLEIVLIFCIVVQSYFVVLRPWADTLWSFWRCVVCHVVWGKHGAKQVFQSMKGDIKMQPIRLIEVIHLWLSVAVLSADGSPCCMLAWIWTMSRIHLEKQSYSNKYQFAVCSLSWSKLLHWGF